MKNNLQPRHLDTVFLFFSLKNVIDLIWNTKNRNDQAFCVDLFSLQQSVSSAEFCSRGWAGPGSRLLFLRSLGDQLFGLQLHLCRPFQGHIH